MIIVGVIAILLVLGYFVLYHPVMFGRVPPATGPTTESRSGRGHF